jgi:hypothetical protein
MSIIINTMQETTDSSGRSDYAGGVGRSRRRVPADAISGWPDRIADDPAMEAVRLLVHNLQTAIDGRSLRAVETITGVDHTTVHAILAGRTWPDTLTVARLEQGLGVSLWPTRDLAP